MSARGLCCALAIAVLTASSEVHGQKPHPQDSSFTAVDALAQVYDYILDARFDQADAELERACGPAPLRRLRRPRRNRHLVADPDRSREPALDGEFSDRRRRGHRLLRSVGGARSGQRRGAVLSRRGLCGPGAVACAA